jgi:hypothetical protein
MKETPTSREDKERTVKSRLASLAIFLLTMSGSRSAFAGECTSVEVEAEPELTDRIRAALDAHDDIDACAHVIVMKRHGKFVVTVTLPDGRSTSRSVTRADDLVPTVQALLLVPRPIEATPEPEVASSPIEEAPIEVGPAAIDAVPAPAERPFVRPEPPTRVLVELSLMSGPRLTDTYPALAVGALSFAEAHRWLIGFMGRADHYPETAGISPSTAVSLMVLVGRRLHFSSVSWDFYGGGGLGRRGGAGDRSQSARVVDTSSTVRSRFEISESPDVTVPRVMLGSRVNFRPRSTFRTFIALDADAGWQGREEGDRGLLSDLERFPTLSLGLSFGATVGTL